MAAATIAASTNNGTALLKDFLHRDPEFLTEFWALHTLGMFIIILRFPVQIRRVGFKGLEMDDYVGIVTLTTWVSTMTMVEQVYHYGTNVDVSQAQVDQLSQGDINSVIYGSKCQEVAWYCYVSLLWSMKLTILLFYKRLIGHLWNEKVFRAVGIFAAMSYTAVILTISLSCRPYPANWQVQPLPSFECTFKPKNLLLTTGLNISTDIVILVLAVPLLRELNVPLMKKVFVMILLCSGIFVISAAIMRVVLTLQGVPSTETINRWGVRECLVGASAINAPALRPLFTRSFWRGSPKVAPPVASRKRGMPHSRGKRLAREGFKMDSVVGWWKSSLAMSFATRLSDWRTWQTSETTFVDQSGSGTITNGAGDRRRMADQTGRTGLETMTEVERGGEEEYEMEEYDMSSSLGPIQPIFRRDTEGTGGSDTIDIELGYLCDDGGDKVRKASDRWDL